MRNKFFNILWNKEIIDALQKVEPTQNKQRNWQNGGCFILAQGIFDWVKHYDPDVKVEAVWDSWDEDPYHVGVRITKEWFLDSTGVRCCDEILQEWEDYFRGGAFLAPITKVQAQAYDIVVDEKLSEKIRHELYVRLGSYNDEIIMALKGK